MQEIFKIQNKKYGTVAANVCYTQSVLQSRKSGVESVACLLVTAVKRQSTRQSGILNRIVTCVCFFPKLLNSSEMLFTAAASVWSSGDGGEGGRPCGYWLGRWTWDQQLPGSPSNGPARACRSRVAQRLWNYYRRCCRNLIPPSLRFNGHFPGEPGLAGVYWSKGWLRWWWQLEIDKSCKAPVKSSPPTNKQFFSYGPDALPVAQSTVSKH